MAPPIETQSAAPGVPSRQGAAPQRLPIALSAAFAFSGTAALINEVAAARALAIPLGADAAGIAAVFTALLLGFAAGGAAAGILLARGVDARRFSLFLEGGLAACSILAPFVVSRLGALVALAGSAFPIDSGAFVAFRFLLALTACLPAALLMGATFPAALRLARAEGLTGASAAAAVYAPNTLGAAAGALTCGFWLLPAIGYPGAFATAAASNMAAFLGLWFFARASSAKDEAPLTPGARLEYRALAATGLAGFAAFTLEVALTRSAVNVFGASTYALTAVLVAFLLGLSLGAPFAARASGNPALARKYLLWSLLGAAILTKVGVLGFQYYLGLDDPFRADNRFPRLAKPWLLPWYQTIVSMILLLPPALALGAAFPLAVGAARAKGASPDRAAGWTYAVNTAGCLAGTLLTTFVLLPSIETRGAVEVACAVLVVAALTLVEKKTWPAFTVLVLYALLTPRRLGAEPGVNTLFFREGVASTVRVSSSVNDDGAPIRSLSVNGTVVATQFFLDLRLQRMLGHLPALLHPKPSNTLVIGLGTGVTAGSLATTPGVDRVDVVELERFVLTAAALFDESNERIASGGLSKVRFTIADGRTHLLTTSQKYDVITCDPIHPWVAGAGNLYSRDCFEQEKARLAPGGLVALWLPLYKLRSDDLRVVARTFTSVFRTSTLYITGYDAILLGADGPFPVLDGADLRQRFAQLSSVFSAIEVRSLEDLMSGFALGDAELREFAAGAPENTDARPILEYRAPLLYLTDYATDFLAFVAPKRMPLAAAFGGKLGLSEAALDRCARARAQALAKFVEFAATDIGRAIREASAVFRTEVR